MIRRTIAIPTATLLILSTGFAHADLRFCNGTGSRVGVAIGYKGGADWVSEGWWNIDPGDCRTILEGSLSSRFYYVHAIDYDQGGEWGGETAMCTRDTSFTISGTQRCEQRGYATSGFYEVDTGERKTFTIQLLDDALQGSEAQ